MKKLSSWSLAVYLPMIYFLSLIIYYSKSNFSYMTLVLVWIEKLKFQRQDMSNPQGRTGQPLRKSNSNTMGQIYDYKLRN